MRSVSQNIDLTNDVDVSLRYDTLAYYLNDCPKSCIADVLILVENIAFLFENKHELAYRLRVAQPTWVDVPIYFDILLYYFICLCITCLLPLSLFKEDY